MRMSRPDLIAHRGYARRCPENTLAAIHAALEVGARFVEVDVQLSADRVPFLFHDRTLERLCGLEQSLGALEATALAQLSVSGEPLASLEDAVAALAAVPGVHAFLELKRASIEVLGAAAVLDAVLPRLEPLAGRCTLISFDVGALRLARERCDVPLGPVLEAWEQKDADEVADLAPEVVFCNVLRLPSEGPLEVPGGRLAAYEVDDPRRALELHARGVAMIETFAIGELLHALEEPA